MAIYLDHAASTPTDPQVVEAMLPYFTEVYGNASGMHRQARGSARAIDEARRTVANILGCSPKEIVFTACGSESDNIAIRGVAWAQQQAGRGDLRAQPGAPLPGEGQFVVRRRAEVVEALPQGVAVERLGRLGLDLLAGAALHEFSLAYSGQPDSRDRRFLEEIVTWVFERQS